MTIFCQNSEKNIGIYSGAEWGVVFSRQNWKNCLCLPFRLSTLNSVWLLYLSSRGNGNSKTPSCVQYKIPTVIRSTHSGCLRILWNFTTYDVFPSTSTKHPNRASIRCTYREKFQLVQLGLGTSSAMVEIKRKKSDRLLVEKSIHVNVRGKQPR